MNKRELFGFSNGHSDPSNLDKWHKWIRNRHPELVNQFIGEVHQELISDPEDDEEVGMAFVAMAQALLISGSQLMFDIATGAVFGEDAQEELKLEKGEILHNIDQAKTRTYEYVENVFAQFKEEVLRGES
jgi:hypothetical protein